MLILGSGYPRFYKYTNLLREEPTRILSLGCKEKRDGGGGRELNKIKQLCTWFLSQCVVKDNTAVSRDGHVVKDNTAVPLDKHVIWKVSYSCHASVSLFLSCGNTLVLSFIGFYKCLSELILSVIPL